MVKILFFLVFIPYNTFNYLYLTLFYIFNIILFIFYNLIYDMNLMNNFIQMDRFIDHLVDRTILGHYGNGEQRKYLIGPLYPKIK